MNRLLVLARGDSRQFDDLAGDSVLRGLPFPALVFVDKAHADYVSRLGGDITIELVKWHDREATRALARRCHAAEPLRGIAVLDEHEVDFAAELREELGLPGMKPQVAARFRDKLLMKRVLADAGLRVPEFADCADRDAVEKLLAKHRRLVVKPADGLGSREVLFIETIEELDRWAGEKHQFQVFEAEEFIDGVLYHVNAIVRDGKPVFTASAPYLPNMSNIDFTKGAPFVTALLTEGDLKARLEEFSNRAIAALGMQDGITHLECFVTPQGEIVFCEIAARPGGGGIVLMIEGQYGINYTRAVLLLDGGRPDLVVPGPGKRDSMLGLVGFRQSVTGFVKRAPTPDMFSEPWIRHARVTAEPGKMVVAASHCTDYVGLLVFASADQAEFDSRRLELQERFYSSLEVQPL